MAGESLAVSLAKVALAVAICLPLVLYLAQDALIFHRQPIPQARHAELLERFPAVEDVLLSTPEGERLHAWRVRADGPLVLYFGGNAEEVSWMLERIGDPRRGETPGVGWLLADYRGYGASTGRPSEKALVADAIRLYDHAARLPGVDRHRIFAFGRSLGSGVAVALAAQRPVRALVLVAPFDSLAEVAKRYYPWLPVDWLLRHRFDSIALAPRIAQPVLALLAERDEVIPTAHAERLLAAWGGPVRRVRLIGAGHNSTDAHPLFWPEIRRFIGEHGAG
ncbi:MAG: alpha/beta hydrolase [Burkholderiales bacterium]|nr:alpha/beta hydrolase [Burkholderiales bacterium]